MHEEVWVPIGGYEGSYEVSDAGRVKSLPRRSRLQEKILSGHRDKGGYRVVNLSRNSKSRPRRVHQLVLLAFVGPCPDGHEACHNDGDPGNNSVSNLRWDTKSANALDKVTHGTHPSLLKTHCPRGHELSSPNLMIGLMRRLGKRACLSCKRAKGYLWTHEGDLQETSDRYYTALMAGV